MVFSNPRNFFYIRVYALVQIGVGLGVALIVAKQGSLTCDRTSNQCHYQSGSLLGAERETFPVSALKGATIETQEHRDRYKRVTYTYRVLIQANQKPLIDNHWSGNEPARIVRQINEFVGSEQRSLQVSQDERLPWVPVGIALSGAGFLLLKRCRKP
jgi:hypothetical protein